MHPYGNIYVTVPLAQAQRLFWRMLEESMDRLQEVKGDNGFQEVVFSGHHRAVAHLGSQLL